MTEKMESLQPHRMKQIFAVSDYIPALALQAIVGAVGPAFLSMNHALQAMVVAIAFDLVSGTACALFLDNCEPFKFSKMGKGITSKMLSFSVVYYLSTQPALNVTIAGYDMHIAGAAALWYCVYDWLSVVKHLDDMGAPVPPILRTALSAARDTVNKMNDAKVDASWGAPEMAKLTGKKDA